MMRGQGRSSKSRGRGREGESRDTERERVSEERDSLKDEFRVESVDFQNTINREDFET